MFASQKYQNKKIAIYGMGITGCSAVKAFQKLNAEVVCWDDNKKIRKKIKKLNFINNKQEKIMIPEHHMKFIMI